MISNKSFLGALLLCVMALPAMNSDRIPRSSKKVQEQLQAINSCTLKVNCFMECVSWHKVVDIASIDLFDFDRFGYSDKFKQLVEDMHSFQSNLPVHTNQYYTSLSIDDKHTAALLPNNYIFFKDALLKLKHACQIRIDCNNDDATEYKQHSSNQKKNRAKFASSFYATFATLYTGILGYILYDVGINGLSDRFPAGVAGFGLWSGIAGSCCYALWYSTLYALNQYKIAANKENKILDCYFYKPNEDLQKIMVTADKIIAVIDEQLALLANIV